MSRGGREDAACFAGHTAKRHHRLAAQQCSICTGNDRFVLKARACFGEYGGTDKPDRQARFAPAMPTALKEPRGRQTGEGRFVSQLTITSAIAALAATVAGFAFGAVYYGALSKPWMRAARIDPADARMSASLLIGTFVLQLVIAVGLVVVFAALPPVSLAAAAGTGVLLALAFAVAPMAVNHRYQDAGLDLTLIDGIHWLGVFALMSIVIHVVR